MRHKHAKATRVFLTLAMALIVGFFAAQMFMGPNTAGKEQVTLISTHNFEFSDLMRPSDP